MIYVAATGVPGVEPGGVVVFEPGTQQSIGRSEPVQDLLYLVVDPSRRLLYGVSGVDAGLLHTWRIVGTDLVPLHDPVSTGGREPCQLVLDRSGRHPARRELRRVRDRIRRSDAGRR